MRRPVIAGNWKMYKTQADARAFFGKLIAAGGVVAALRHRRRAALHRAGGRRGSGARHGDSVAAQNGHWEKEGAFTGEVSMPMLVEAGCSGVIIGHSERRHIFHETNETVAKKVRAALDFGLRPIVCVGETLGEREANLTHAVLETQFEGAFAALTGDDFSRILLAYEPVWAIGTGRTATPEIAAEAHRYLRELAQKRFSTERASALRILYGGSVKPDNIKGLMAQVEIDGALVGGASLDAQSFASIVNF